MYTAILAVLLALSSWSGGLALQSGKSLARDPSPALKKLLARKGFNLRVGSHNKDELWVLINFDQNIDSDLALIAQCPQVRSLTISRTRLTKDSLHRIAALSHVRDIGPEEMEISEDVLSTRKFKAIRVSQPDRDQDKVRGTQLLEAPAESSGCLLL